MRKYKNILAILACVIFGTYGIFILGLHLSPRDAFFNKTFRKTLTNSNISRSIFFLNSWADARKDYFAKNTEEIIIEIDTQQARYPSSMLESDLTEKLSKATNRRISVHIKQDKKIPDLASFDSKYIQTELAQEAQDYFPSKNQKHIHVFFLSSYQDDPNFTGLPINSSTIAVFQDRITNITNDTNLRARLESAVVLHLIGKLWGLEYIDRTNCIMYPQIGYPEDVKFDKYNVAENFCPESLVKLDEMMQ